MDIKEIRRINLESLIFEFKAKAKDEEEGTMRMFGKKVGVEASYLSTLRNSHELHSKNPEKQRNIGSPIARRIESAFRRPLGWMDQLHGADEIKRLPKSIFATHSRVPLIEWAAVGAWRKKPSMPDGDSDFVETSIVAGPQMFALQITGDVMAPEFSDSSRIIVDPTLEAQSQDFVIVVTSPAADAMCRQLVVDGGRKFLRPCNPAYPTEVVTRGSVICGVVREQQKRYR